MFQNIVDVENLHNDKKNLVFKLFSLSFSSKTISFELFQENFLIFIYFHTYNEKLQKFVNENVPVR